MSSPKMMGKIEARPPPGGKPRDGRHCDLCGCSQPAVRCDKCGCQIFCLSCDDMYHRHPKRRFHLRKAVDPSPAIPQARPVLPMKVSHLNTTNPGDPSKMPLPPPRKKKSLFGSFKRPSPSSDHSPPLPKKEYSWTDRLGSIKKFMSNRPLPPLPTGDDNDSDQQHTANGQQSPRGDLSFIHKRNEERPPQLPQRSPKAQEFPAVPERDNRIPFSPAQMPAQLKNGSFEQNINNVNQNREFQNGEENQWHNRMNVPNQNGHQAFHQHATLSRQNQRGYMPPGMPGYTGTMHQSSSATDLHNLTNMEGMPNAAHVPPHYPHYPMTPHMPPHYPYPMYPQFPNYPQYFGNSFANLSNPPTTDGDVSDQSETSMRHSSKKYPFRKRAKRSQSVMMDRMQFPGQYYPFGPFPGYGPWGAPMPVEAPPSPSGSVRSLNRTGRSRRRKKMTSEDDDEEISASSSPMSRPKSSSSERPPKDTRRAPLATQTTSSEEESEGEADNRRNKANTIQRRFSDPKQSSPATDFKKSPKLKKRSSSRQSDSETQDVPRDINEVKTSRESIADQSNQPRVSPASVPSNSWECRHCTFVNPINSKICQVCCKTATPRTETPVTANSRSSSAAESSRKPSVDLDKESPSPVNAQKQEEDTDKKDKRDMAILNSALDEAEKEISRGLEELMKLKEDMDNNISKGKSSEAATETNIEAGEASKPVYKSTGKMRTSILDKLSVSRAQPSKSTASTATETQTGQANWAQGKIIEARRHSNSSTTSETFNSPLAQSPELDNNCFNKEKRDSSCQTQQDSLIDYLGRKKAAEEAFLGRPINNFGFGYGDRVDMMTSPVPPMYDRYIGGGFGMMQRSHSRASLFTGRLNEPGPFDYGGFGYGGAPMYRSISRSSLTGDYPDGRLSDFHNLRKPDFYLSMEELVERRRQESVRAQGLELVRMIREAEQQGFTAEDIQVALTHCGKQSPMEWLQENWRNMVDSVVTLSTNYGNDKKENDIGLLSENEARDALRLHKGNIWAAVTECVESRQRKYFELSARGKFSRKDIVEALNSSDGDVEMAYAKLSKTTGKPFLMRIWGAGEGVQNQDGAIPIPDDAKDATLKYRKEDLANSDYLSDDIWSEDGVVGWDEDDDFDDEKGDLEDLQTCHEDLYSSPQSIKTPESDKSDYCDAFPAEDRNMSSPSDDIFFVIPEAKKEKKRGLLSKLAALRKDSKELEERPKLNQQGETSHQNLQSKEDTISQNSTSSSEKTKHNGTLSAIKSTLSAIKDTVTGGSKSDKKAPCSQPERRTIVVRGQLDNDASDFNVKIISMQPRDEDGSRTPNFQDANKKDSDMLINEVSKTIIEKEESLQDNKTINKDKSKSDKTESITKSKTDNKKSQSVAEKLKFAKQSVPVKSDSKSSNVQSSSTVPNSQNVKNGGSLANDNQSLLNQNKSESLHVEEKNAKPKIVNKINKEISSHEKIEKLNSEKITTKSDINSEIHNKQSKSNIIGKVANVKDQNKVRIAIDRGPSTSTENDVKLTSLKPKTPPPNKQFIQENKTVDKTGEVDKGNKIEPVHKGNKTAPVPDTKQKRIVKKETKSSTNQNETLNSAMPPAEVKTPNVLTHSDKEDFENSTQSPHDNRLEIDNSLSREYLGFKTGKDELQLKNEGNLEDKHSINQTDVQTSISSTVKDSFNISNIKANEFMNSDATGNDKVELKSKVEAELKKMKKESFIQSPESLITDIDISPKIPINQISTHGSSNASSNAENAEEEKNIKVIDGEIQKPSVINTMIKEDIYSNSNKSKELINKDFTIEEDRNRVLDRAITKSGEIVKTLETKSCIEQENNNSNKSERDTKQSSLHSSGNSIIESTELPSSTYQKKVSERENKSSAVETIVEKLTENEMNSSILSDIPGPSSSNAQNVVQNITSQPDCTEKKFSDKINKIKSIDSPIPTAETSQKEKDINSTSVNNITQSTDHVNTEINQQVNEQNSATNTNEGNIINSESASSIKSLDNVIVDGVQSESQPSTTPETIKSVKTKSSKTGKTLKKSKSLPKISKESQNIESKEMEKTTELQATPGTSKNSPSTTLNEINKEIITDVGLLNNHIPKNSEIVNEPLLNKNELVENTLPKIETELKIEPTETENNFETFNTKTEGKEPETETKLQAIVHETKLQESEVKMKKELLSDRTLTNVQTEEAAATDSVQPVDLETKHKDTETELKIEPAKTETQVQSAETTTTDSLKDASGHLNDMLLEQKETVTVNLSKTAESFGEASSTVNLEKIAETFGEASSTVNLEKAAETFGEASTSTIIHETKIGSEKNEDNVQLSKPEEIFAEASSTVNHEKIVETFGEASSSTITHETKIGSEKNDDSVQLTKPEEIPGTSTINAIPENSSHDTSTSASITDEPKADSLKLVTEKSNSSSTSDKFNSQSKIITENSNSNIIKLSSLPESFGIVSSTSFEPKSEPEEQQASVEASSSSQQHSNVQAAAMTEISDTLNNKPPRFVSRAPHRKSIPEETPENETNGEESEEDIQFSDESRPSSVTPPSPVDALRSRFEGLAGGMSVRGPIRPQSPFRRMSFNSRKQVIALERKRDIIEKPWFHQKVVTEPVKITQPKRSIKQQLEMERKVRKMVADRKCRTYKKAEIVVQLMDMNFDEEEAIQAANECSTLEQAISYLQQECLLCTGYFPVSQIVSMTHCQHRACRECIRAYFTVQIRDRTILDLLCPFCNEPDIGDEDIASDYFNHLDIMLKKLVDVEIHELFQRKLRDRVLMKDPNFRWCSQCSSGFIAMPNLKRLVCPDCNAVTCASCRRLWEREHQGISCEAFAALKDATDPEAQAAGLAKLLTEDGIDCPCCHFRYALAKGGCMHFRCIQCQHDFCSGCSRPFKMGQKCGVSEFCAKLGLHAHHPRNCLFYLRDKEPEDLQKLLQMNDIEYNVEPPEGMEVNNTCQVMEQKETTDGMVDDCCGKEIQDGFAGLCRIHYVEYLGQLVNKYKVDPIQIFDNDDLELVLRRANIRLPPKRYRETEIQYREKLVNLIQDELPLDKMDGS